MPAPRRTAVVAIYSSIDSHFSKTSLRNSDSGLGSFDSLVLFPQNMVTWLHSLRISYIGNVHNAGKDKGFFQNHFGILMCTAYLNA